jgi:hypothetical protein
MAIVGAGAEKEGLKVTLNAYSYLDHGFLELHGAHGHAHAAYAN